MGYSHPPPGKGLAPGGQTGGLDVVGLVAGGKYVRSLVVVWNGLGVDG